jgi:Fe-S cluster assembly iron-binding protein IscA
MFEVTDSARDEIVRVLKEAEEKKAVRVYIAGHG